MTDAQFFFLVAMVFTAPSLSSTARLVFATVALVVGTSFATHLIS